MLAWSQLEVRSLLAGPLVVGILLMGCGHQTSEAASSKAWVRECPGNAFCFSRPATLASQPVQAIDSLAGVYRSDTLMLSFDMGRYATSVEHLNKPTEEAVTIDGKSARLLVAEKEIVVIVPKVRESGPFTVQFTMVLRFNGNASLALAKRIFQSIEFKTLP